MLVPGGCSKVSPCPPSAQHQRLPPASVVGKNSSSYARSADSAGSEGSWRFSSGCSRALGGGEVWSFRRFCSFLKTGEKLLFFQQTKIVRCFPENDVSRVLGLLRLTLERDKSTTWFPDSKKLKPHLVRILILLVSMAPAWLKVNHVVRIVLVHVVAVVAEMPALETKSLHFESGFNIGFILLLFTLPIVRDHSLKDMLTLHIVQLGQGYKIVCASY